MIKPFLNDNKWDILVVVFILVFSTAIWWPSQYYPLFWDSTFVVHLAQNILKSNFTNFVNPDPGYAQPTLIGILLAVVWRFFGTSTSVSHAIMFPFLPLLLISTYFFIKKSTNRTLGFLGTTFIAFTPVVLAEYINVYVDLPTAAFAATSLLFWQRKKYIPWAFFYALALLSKLPAIALAPYFFFQSFYISKKMVLLSALTPMAVIASWLAYHYYLTGWLLVSPHITLAFAKSAFNPLPEMAAQFYYLFINQGKVYLTISAGLCAIYLIIQKKVTVSTFKKLKTYEDLIPLVSATAVFTFTGEFFLRYAILVIVFYIHIIAKIFYTTIRTFKKSDKYVYGMIIICLVLITNQWHPRESIIKTTRFYAPDDLGLIDYMHIFRTIAAYAQVNRTENYVYYGAFPENVSLTDPDFGLVQTPVPFFSCKDFAYNPNEKQVVIIHPFSPTQAPCHSILQTQATSILSGSEQNGKWVDLYLIGPPTSTPSATIK